MNLRPTPHPSPLPSEGRGRRIWLSDWHLGSANEVHAHHIHGGARDNENTTITCRAANPPYD
jgi:hypothetical protein